jgi:glycosyltransferase involved in cell wall biosynthesis
MLVRALPVHRAGGLEFHTWDLVRALARRGHEIVLLTSKLTHEDRIRMNLPDGVTVHEVPGTRPGNYSISFFRNAETAITRLDAEQRFDIVHAQELAGLFLNPRAGRYLVTVHGTMTSEVPLDRRYFSRLTPREKLAAAWKYKQRIALLPAFRTMLDRADRLLVDSDFTRRELLRIRQDIRHKLALVPLGIDPERYPAGERPARPDDIPRLGILGRLQRMKGVEVALRSAEQLRHRGVLFRMVIAGTGDYANALQAEVQRLGLQDHVELRGRLDSDEAVRDFFQSTDVLLFPDLTQPAFGLVAVEAMHYGVPVVGARSGAIPEVVTEDVGWLYDGWNAGELSALLAGILRDPVVLARKRESAIACATTFTADKMAESTEGVSRGLVGL